MFRQKRSSFNNGNHNSGAVELSAHENFHAFQNSWQQIEGSLQDEANFPITKEIMQLQMLTQHIFRDLPNDNISNADLTEILKQYVAIRTKEMEIDPSTDKLIKNHANNQEWIEGSARYAELMATREFYEILKNTKFANDTLFEKDYSIKSDLRVAMSATIFYHTGSAVLYILKRLGVQVEDISKGKQQYTMAAEHLNLSKTDMDAALLKAQNNDKWSTIQQKATDFSKLQ